MPWVSKMAQKVMKLPESHSYIQYDSGTAPGQLHLALDTAPKSQVTAEGKGLKIVEVPREREVSFRLVTRQYVSSIS